MEELEGRESNEKRSDSVNRQEPSTLQKDDCGDVNDDEDDDNDDNEYDDNVDVVNDGGGGGDGGSGRGNNGDGGTGHDNDGVGGSVHDNDSDGERRFESSQQVQLQAVGEKNPGGRPSTESEVSVGRGRGRGNATSSTRSQGSRELKPGVEGRKGISLRPLFLTYGRGSLFKKEGPLLRGYECLDLVPARETKQTEKKPGRRFLVETNLFPLELKKRNVIAYQYEVTVEPEKPRFLVRLAWNEFVRRNFPGRRLAFDGKKMAVSPGPLSKKEIISDTFEITNPDNYKQKEYKISLRLTAKLNMDGLFTYLEIKDNRQMIPAPLLVVLDLVMRYRYADRFVLSGKSFFTKPKGRVLSLGDGMEVWHGFTQSVILGWKPYLNFDVAHKGFPISDLLVAMKEICNVKGDVDENTILQKKEIDRLTKHLKNLKVMYRVPGDPMSKRVYKVNEVRDVPCYQEYFHLEEFGLTTVVEYFFVRKHYSVRFPNLPCLWVGSMNHRIYVPMELCSIVSGQVKNGRLNESQTTRMIQHTADPPTVRKKKIESAMRMAKIDTFFTNDFGISVSGEFEQVEARVLDPPQLQSAQGMKVSKGKWDLKKLLNAKALLKWCVLNLDSDNARIYEKSFQTMLREHALRMGMDAKHPVRAAISCSPFQPTLVSQTFAELKESGVDFVFVIIPDRGDTYPLVKKICEIDIGILTQCVRTSTVRKAVEGTISGQSTFLNILLKVNAKLNGTNHSLLPVSRPKCLQGIAMIVGADMMRPSPEAAFMPSIVAVAASHDPTATQYHTIRQIQSSKMETIQNFDDIMRDHLLFFYRKTGYKPERIIIFRDGVNEGQVDVILKEEVTAMRKACTSLQSWEHKDEYQPPITYVIVQKRHHIRFFPLPGNRYCNEKFQNVPPGTCVDTQIVHPRDLDFYLVSHASKLGTARPTKYKLIYDDSDMSENELETLTYYLCHLLSRCCKSISYPAPTYYAHLAALRGKVHFSAVNPEIRSGKYCVENISISDYFADAPMFFV